MKTNRFLSHSTLILLTAFLLSAASVRAQTFIGQSKLRESPTHLEAAIYPLTNEPSTIKVIFNNRTGGAVRVVIRDEKGRICYDELTATVLYRRHFDLASLPQGSYKVELSKKDEQYTQAFAVQPSVQSYIALENAPVQTTPDKKADKRLIVSQ